MSSRFLFWFCLVAAVLDLCMGELGLAAAILAIGALTMALLGYIEAKERNGWRDRR